MSIEQNRIIAEWLGWKWIESKSKRMPFDPYWQYPTGMYVPAGQSDFDKDSVAVSLLSVLVDRGYDVVLLGGNKEWHLAYVKRDCQQDMDAEIDKMDRFPTVAAAITSAVLQLINTAENEYKAHRGDKGGKANV